MALVQQEKFLTLWLTVCTSEPWVNIFSVFCAATGKDTESTWACTEMPWVPLSCERGQSIRQETSLLERTTNRQTGRSDLGMWQTFSQKWTKLAYHFKEDNWQYLLPVIVFELLSQKFKFWRTFIHHSGPDSFFSWDGATPANVTSWCCQRRRTGQHLEGLQTSATRYSANDQCLASQKLKWAKDPLKM